MKKISIALALALAASAAFGSSLSKKYKNWDRSPQAYFLTASERADWKKVQTDADAEKFVHDYLERRGPGFEKMLSDRVTVADKYFSAGSTKGSETLRGKVVIVFGPPSSIEQEKGGGGKAGADPNRAGMTTDVGVSSSGIGGSPTSPAPRHVAPPTFTFVYDAAHAPKAIGKAFQAEINVISSSYQEAANPSDLDAKFEAVAEASLHPDPAPAEAPAPAPPSDPPPPNPA